MSSFVYLLRVISEKKEQEGFEDQRDRGYVINVSYAYVYMLSIKRK